MISNPTVRLGEVIEASTTEFTTQCYELYESPPLGALVRCGGGPSVMGVVASHFPKGSIEISIGQTSRY